MKFEIEYSNNIESVLKVLNNPDARKFCVWFTTINAICSEYKDKKSIDLVLKIYDITGFNFFLSEKHTYKELEKFYEQIQPIDLDKYVDFPDFSNLKDEPEEEQEEEQEEEKEEEQEEEQVYGKVSRSFDNANVTDSTDQRTETINEANAKRAAKRAALKKMKPDV